MKSRIFKSGLAVLTPVLMWAGLVSIFRAANLYRDSNDPAAATADTLYFGTDTVALTWAPSPFSAASHPR